MSPAERGDCAALGCFQPRQELVIQPLSQHRGFVLQVVVWATRAGFESSPPRGANI